MQNKFFHLPSLYVYLIAVILLVTSVFYAGTLLKDLLYYAFDLNYNYNTIDYSKEYFDLTTEAEAYLQQLNDQRVRSYDIANIVKRIVMLLFSVGAFWYFWRRTQIFNEKDLAFTMPNFYFFLVSSIAFLIFFFSFSATINTTVEYMIVGNQPRYFNLYNVYPRPTGEPQLREGERIEVSLEDLKQRLESNSSTEDWGRNRKRQIIDGLAIALVSLPIFWFHDRRFVFAKPHSDQN